MQGWQQLKNEHDELRVIGRKLRYSHDDRTHSKELLEQFLVLFEEHTQAEERIISIEFEGVIPREIARNIYLQHNFIRKKVNELMGAVMERSCHDEIMKFLDYFDSHIMHEDKLLSEYGVYENVSKHQDVYEV